MVYEEFMDSQNATSNDTPLVMRFLETSPTIVNMWNDWGINMKPTGDFHFEGHAYPGRPKIFLKYDGHNQKQAEQAAKQYAEKKREQMSEDFVLCFFCVFIRTRICFI